VSEYSATAPVPPPAFTHVFDTAEFKRFEEGLTRAGWSRVEDASLGEVVADRRLYVHYGAATGLQTRLEVWDMLNAIGVELRAEGSEESHTMFRSEWIGVNRMIAMLDVMGIARASDNWMEWWRREVWR
jgi:hypothetical protein